MRRLFTITDSTTISKWAQTERMKPDVSRFISEVKYLDNEGGDTPQRREFIVRLISASKNIRDYIVEELRDQFSLRPIRPMLIKAFNDGDPWAVKLIDDYTAVNGEPPYVVQLAMKRVGELGAHHMRAIDAWLIHAATDGLKEVGWMEDDRGLQRKIELAFTNGSFSKELYDATVNHMIASGEEPWWAGVWLDNVLRGASGGGETPQWLISMVTKEIRADARSHAMPEGVATWIDRSLRENHPPEWLVGAVAERFAETGHVPHYAAAWVKKMVEMAVSTGSPLPEAMADGIARHLAVAGDASYADPYVSMALERGFATEQMQRVYDEMLDLHIDARRLNNLDNSALGQLHKDNHQIPEWFPPSAKKRLKGGSV